jgi:hypothetical protein
MNAATAAVGSHSASASTCAASEPAVVAQSARASVQLAVVAPYCARSERAGRGAYAELACEQNVLDGARAGRDPVARTGNVERRRGDLDRIARVRIGGGRRRDSLVERHPRLHLRSRTRHIRTS